MNFITKLINRLDEWLEPLHKLSQDEKFRGEMLLAVGLKEPEEPEKKEETKKKLFFLLELLNKLRKLLGLDKSDIPNVKNIIALAVILAEMYAVFKAIRDFLDSCDVIGQEEEDLPGESKEAATLNAIRALCRLLTITLLKKKAPKVAAIAEGVGIFADESAVTRRALDLLLFPPAKLLASADDWFNPDYFRPEGDFRDDDHQRFMKGIFLDLTLLSLTWLNGKLGDKGKLLFNFGYEVPPDLDAFPHAALVANRAMQVQFVPGDAFESHRVLGELSDAIISLVTIPVMPAGDGPDNEPLGYQYALKLELSALDIGTDEEGKPVGPFLLRIPVGVSGGIIWGHDTDLSYFTSDRFGLSTLLEMVIPPSKEPEPTGDTDQNEPPDSVREGEVSLRIMPKLVPVGEEQKDDLEIRLEMRDFSLGISGDGRDGFLQKILPAGTAMIRATWSLVYSPLRDEWTFEGLDERNGLFFSFKVDKPLFGKLNVSQLYMGPTAIHGTRGGRGSTTRCGGRSFCCHEYDARAVPNICRSTGRIPSIVVS